MTLRAAEPSSALRRQIHGTLMQRAWTVTLNEGIVVAQSPRVMLLYARTVHPLAELMNVSEMPFEPSGHTRFKKVPHPMGTVPAGHVVLTVVVQVPDAAGVQLPSVVLAVITVLPGPAGPWRPRSPCTPCGPGRPCKPSGPGCPAGPCSPWGPCDPAGPVGPCGP